MSHFYLRVGYLERTCTTATECFVDNMRTLRLSIQDSANMSPDLAARTVPRGSFCLMVTSLGMPLQFDWTVPVTVIPTFDSSVARSGLL